MDYLAKIDEMFDDWWKLACEKDGEPTEQSGGSHNMVARAAFHAALCGKFGSDERGVALISEERIRQMEVEGWTTNHDDEHVDESLAYAAACYALPAKSRGAKSKFGQEDVSCRGETPVWGAVKHQVPKQWPNSWSASWWNPSSRLRDLVKAGALIAAEIDRHIRHEHTKTINHPGNGGGKYDKRRESI